MLLRRTARPLLASLFIYEGFGALRRPAPHVAAARGPVGRLVRLAGIKRPVTDRDLALAVRAHGALTVVAGFGLAFGRAPRSSAFLLAALNVPLVIAQQPFTKSVIPRAERTEGFVRSLGAVGATLLAGIDLEGKPGMAWRVKNARTERADIRAAVAKATE